MDRGEYAERWHLRGEDRSESRGVRGAVSVQNDFAQYVKSRRAMKACGAGGLQERRDECRDRKHLLFNRDAKVPTERRFAWV